MKIEKSIIQLKFLAGELRMKCRTGYVKVKSLIFKFLLIKYSVMCEFMGRGMG